MEAKIEENGLEHTSRKENTRNTVQNNVQGYLIKLNLYNGQQYCTYIKQKQKNATTMSKLSK